MLIKTDKARRAVVLVMFLLFSIPMGSSLIGTLFSSGSSTQNSAQAEAVNDVQAQITEAEAGYEIVLKREPENRTALEGLLQVRMANENWTGAKQPLEKLIALDPDNQSYPAILEEVNGQLSAATTEGKSVGSIDSE